MRNHNEKIRDMARSVLPSSARKGARDNKAIIKHKNRHKVRQALREWRHEIDPYDYEGFADHDYIYGYAGDQNIKMAVNDRRGADKLSVVHWAERLCATKLADLCEEERLEYFRKVMPDNLIGRHALGHIADKVAPTVRYLHSRYASGSLNGMILDGGVWRDMTSEERQAQREAQARVERQFVINKLYEILATHGAHARFNDALRREHSRIHAFCATKPCFRCQREPVKVRLFEGEHDIQHFADLCSPYYDYCNSYRMLKSFNIRLY
jgi:hypothetical protein